MHHDEKTQAYFDNFVPHYRPERFDFAINFLNQLPTENLSLLDIGCGDGATLAMIKQSTGIRQLTGLDISPNYLAKARNSVNCETIEGSILDDKVAEKLQGKYDICTLGAVIHHLIGNTRRESRELGSLCVKNAMRLLRPGGRLIIFEPTYTPKLMMDLVFWIKKTCVRFTGHRIEILRSWANLGEPVVSYYTPQELDRFIGDCQECKIEFQQVIDQRRFGFLLTRRGIGVIVQKEAQ